MPIPTELSEIESEYLSKIYLWHGIPKIGKTTTAANFGDKDNKIMFFPTEPGHKFQKVYKWKRKDGKDPLCWDDWKDCIREFATDDGGFKCIAVDTLDNLWKWCSNYVLGVKGIEHESDEGFGKGWSAVSKEFETTLTWLVQSGYGVIFLSHSKDKDKQVGPKKISFTDSSLPNGAKKTIHPLCDYIFHFGANEEGKRFIQTKATENVNAGDRSGGLPTYIPMDAEKLKEELNKSIDTIIV
jgi:hypothetical protein